MGEHITRRHLPHWYVPGAAHFVTFRLWGSLPRAFIEQMKHRRRLLLTQRPTEARCASGHRERVHRQLFTAYEEQLDAGGNVRHLNDPRVAALVRESLYHLHGRKYDLLAYSIMPNHVHVVILPYELPCPVDDSELTDGQIGEKLDRITPLADIMHSLKSFTAHKANQVLRRHGAFWQHESYDHWVRDDDELERVVEYTNANAVNAGLASRPHDHVWCSAHDRFLVDGDTSGWLTVGQASRLSYAALPPKPALEESKTKHSKGEESAMSDSTTGTRAGDSADRPDDCVAGADKRDACPTTLVHPRDEIMRTMERIYRYRMTTTSGGNLSIREAGGGIWITPARVDKGSLTRNDIVCVKRDGTVEGPHPASSEFPFHKAIYEARPDIRAIVHAHPVALVAFSICGQTPDTRLFHQAHFVCGRTGFAPYAVPGSEQLGANIAKTFAGGASGSGPDSVILANHGVVVGGSSLSHAFQRFEAFEFAGKTIIRGSRLGEVRYLTDAELDRAHNRSVALESSVLPPATAEEKELRRQLCAFLRRGCRQRLLISTEGSFSARVAGDDVSFLITPTQQDRESLDISDLVLVEGNRREAGKKASRAVFAHQAIYRKHPDVQAIVFAHPVNATAFSVTSAPFDARTIPESYVFLRDVRQVPYGVHFQNDGAIADFVSTSSPAAVLENDGVLVTGTSVLDAFDRLEVLESTAEAVIDAGAIGRVSAMSDAVISELREVFKID